MPDIGRDDSLPPEIPRPPYQRIPDNFRRLRVPFGHKAEKHAKQYSYT